MRQNGRVVDGCRAYKPAAARSSYLASVRDNSRMFSMSAHETIHQKTGIPEEDIRRAHSLLTSVGLLAAIEREYKGVTEKKNEPNKYYLRGYESFVRSSPVAA